RGARPDPDPGRDDRSRRAERRARPRALGPGLRARDGPGHALGELRRARSGPARAAAVPRLGDRVTTATGRARLFAAVSAGGAKPAMLFDGRTWSYAEVDRLSRRYARGLALAGLEAGDRIAVYAERPVETVVALLGHYRLGAPHVPINARYRGEELSHILEDSGAKAVVVEAASEAERLLDGIRPPATLEHRIVIGGSGPLAFERLIETGPPAGAAEALPLPQDGDTAILLYTSGTTGKSKGVALSFRAVVANTLAVTELWRF